MADDIDKMQFRELLADYADAIYQYDDRRASEAERAQLSGAEQALYQWVDGLVDYVPPERKLLFRIIARCDTVDPEAPDFHEQVRMAWVATHNAAIYLLAGQPDKAFAILGTPA